MYSIRSILKGHKNKKPKLGHTRPILKAMLQTNKGKIKLQVLLDSGSTATLMKANHAKHLEQVKEESTTWRTTVGTFKTNSKAKAHFTLPELHEKRTVSWKAHITEAPMSYDMIIGQDCLTALGIDIKFSSQTIEWDGSEMPMRDSEENNEKTSK